jgi:hypothetical protein
MNLENWINTRGTLSINSVAEMPGPPGSKVAKGLVVSFKIKGQSPEVRLLATRAAQHCAVMTAG